MILRGSSSTPITPVEAGSTCVTGSRSSFAAALHVASATASPVRVAQLALPALTSTAPHQALRDAFRCLRPSRTGAACTRFCVNTAAALAGSPLTISARSSFSACADAGVSGGVCVSQRQIQLHGSPKISFSVKRWPLAKSAAGIRLRPSSCTSSSSSAPVAAGDHQRLQADERPPGARARARRATLRLPDVQRSGRESWCTRPARAAGRARDCGSPAPAAPIDRAVFLLQQRRERRLRVVLLLRHDRARRQPGQRLDQQVRAHHRQPRAQFDRSLLRADLRFRLQQHVAGVQARVDPHRGHAGARLAVARSPTGSAPAPRYFGSSDACTLMMPSGARSITDLRNDLPVADHHHGVAAAVPRRYSTASGRRTRSGW